MKLRSNIEVMKFQRLAVVVLIGAVVALLAAAYELYFGGRIVVAEERASVFNSEYAAAYEGALNRACESIAQGESSQLGAGFTKRIADTSRRGAGVLNRDIRPL